MNRRELTGETGPGQERLTEREKDQLPLGNQYTDRRQKPIMCWQAVKGAAMHYGVSDWTSIADPELTYEENIALMKEHGTKNGAGPSLKHRPIALLERR